MNTVHWIFQNNFFFPVDEIVEFPVKGFFKSCDTVPLPNWKDDRAADLDIWAVPNGRLITRDLTFGNCSFVAVDIQIFWQDEDFSP